MSEHGRSLIKCQCGYNRFRTTTRVNILRCFKCGREHGITKTIRYQGQDSIERDWDRKAESTFELIRKASE